MLQSNNSINLAQSVTPVMLLKWSLKHSTLPKHTVLINQHCNSVTILGMGRFL